MTIYLYKQLCDSVLIAVMLIKVTENCGKQNYVLNDGSACYWITPYDGNSSSSDMNCMMHNGTLAIIPTPEVNEEIFSKSSIVNYHRLWIGVNDIAMEGVYRYVDGRNVTWVNWANGQPSGPDFRNSQQRDCVYLHIRNSTMKWYDDVCTKIYRALCYRKLSEAQVLTTLSITKNFLNMTTSSTISRTPTYASPDTFLTTVSVVGVGIIITIGLATLIICLRKKKLSQKKTNAKIDFENDVMNVQYDTIENETSNGMCYEINGYDILHHQRFIIPNDNLENTYDHTNVNNEYDTTNRAMKDRFDDNYDKAQNHRLGKLTLPGRYDEILQNQFSKTTSSQKPEICNNYVEQSKKEELPEKSLKDKSLDDKERVYFILEKDANYQEDC